MNYKADTIVAISTPLGEGGIGIVRLSGEKAIEIADGIFMPSKGRKMSGCKSGTIHHGFIKALDNELLDEVLLSIMKGPGTYTTEDIIEINCHGGAMPLKKVLEICIEKGARLAEPGEFTKRAFLNGRIDLSQAEAVLDVIKSESEVSHKVAMRHLKGTLSEEIRNLRHQVLDILALVELGIDFSQEDVEAPSVSNIVNRVREISCVLEKLVNTAEKGMVLREGGSVVICGRPNVGKSSLMNALLKHDRVIVTPIAGTTRDVIEEHINISGAKIRLSDTAGIIETKDRVEIEGIKRSKKKLEEADIVLLLLDVSNSLSVKDEEIFSAVKGKKVIFVANKNDLPKKLEENVVREKFKAKELLYVSVLKKEGLDSIEDAIAKELFKGDLNVGEGTIVTNVRHKKLLEKAYKCLCRAKNVAEKSYSGELLASDLNEAVHELGLIIGESVEDDILDRIFSQFCIGK